jgi:D-3-phosphoglycerate dehydrogenase
MKPGVRIINDARGSLIDENALAEAIKAGHVAGAALDVYSVEPVAAENPLLGLPNVIHTPHLGASTFEAQDQVATQIAQQVIDALATGDYRNVVNPEVLKRIQA